MKRLLIIFAFLFLVSLPFSARAAETCDYGKVLPQCTCDGSCTLESFIQLFANLYQFGLEILLPLGAFFIVLGSVILLTASGYSNRIDMGKNIVRQAVTGTIIVLLSWVIVDTAIVLISGDQKNTVFGRPWYAGFTYACGGNLSNGCTGAEVNMLQENLRTLGYNLPKSKVYDAKTAAAVERFQNDVNARVLKPTALASCDPEVWKKVVGKNACVSPYDDATNCSATEQELVQKKLSTGRDASEATQGAAASLAGGSVSLLFNTKCRS